MMGTDTAEAEYKKSQRQAKQLKKAKKQLQEVGVTTAASL